MPDAARAGQSLRAGLRQLADSLDAALARVEEGDFARADLTLKSAYETAFACDQYLLLFSENRRQTVDPTELLRKVSAQSMVKTGVCGPDESVIAQGDPEQLIACLRLALENGRTASRGALHVAFFRGGPGPRYEIDLVGGGAFDERFRLGDVFVLGLAEYAGCWGAAVEGGRVDWSPDEMVLYFGGGPPAPAQTGLPRGACRITRAMVRRLQAWRGAIGGDDGLVSPEEAGPLYRVVVERSRQELEELLQLLPAVL